MGRLKIRGSSVPVRARQKSLSTTLAEVATQEETWTAEQVEVFQLTQLRNTVRIAETRCQLYKQRFADAGVSYLDLHTLDDFSRFPLSSKVDLESHAPRSSNQAEPARSWREAFTPGGVARSSRPISTSDVAGRSQLETTYLDQLLRRSGAAPEKRVVYLWNEGDLQRGSSKRWSFDIRRRTLQLSAAALDPDQASDYLDRITKFEPHTLVGYPSAIITLALELRFHSRPPPAELQTIIATSERLDLEQQRFLEGVFEAEILARYVQSERVASACQTPENDLYHFSPGYGYAELGQPDDNGLQEVIVTSFHNDGRPIVRYQTGDLVAAGPQDRSKKSFPWLTVAEFVGHTEDYLFSSSGEKVWPVNLSLRERPLRDIVGFQFVQDELGVATFRYLATKSLSKQERNLLRRRLNATLGREFKIHLERSKRLWRDSNGRLPWVVRSD